MKNDSLDIKLEQKGMTKALIYPFVFTITEMKTTAEYQGVFSINQSQSE